MQGFPVILVALLVLAVVTFIVGRRGWRYVRKSRFIVGLVLCLLAAALEVFGKGDYATAGVIGLAMIGIAAIATSRRLS